MVEFTLVTDHINTLNTQFFQLTPVGYKIDEEECVELLLQSLPDSYDHLIINLMNNSFTGYLVFDEIAIACFAEDEEAKVATFSFLLNLAKK